MLEPLAHRKRGGRPGRRSLLVALVAAASTALWGCSSTTGARRLLLKVVVAARSNNNSPIPVALVAVTDPKLFEKIAQMSAKQWFEQREQLRRDYPDGEAFTEWEWEYVPGQSPQPAVIEIDGRAAGAMIFANYRSPGDHRYRLGPQRRMRIDLEEDDFIVSPLEAPDEQPDD